MTNIQLYTQISSLPENLKKEVADFVKSLMNKSKQNQKPKERKLGLAKGLIKIDPDFDEPLEEFKKYM